MRGGFEALATVALRAGADELAPSADLGDAVAIVADHVPADERQAAVRERILAFTATHPEALHRSSLEGHLTGSALVVDPAGRVLLGLHRKLGRWLQLGGHCDGDANLAATALREAVEESGIADLAVVPLVLDLDVHPIPARPEEPEHLHLDVRYLVLAPAGSRPVRSSESRDLRWFAPAELGQIELDASLARLVTAGLRLL